MKAEIQQLLKPLNLTRHNRKKLEDFSGVMGLVASVSDDLRNDLLEELMISAISGKNIAFIQAIDSLDDFVDSGRIEYILTSSLINSRMHFADKPSSKYIKGLWDKLSVESQHEVVASLFTTTVSVSGDKDLDMQMAEYSLNTLSMLNNGDVDLFVNTIISAHLTTPISKSINHSLQFSRVINAYLISPIYDHDLLDDLNKIRFTLKNYEESLGILLKVSQLEGNYSKVCSILSSHLSTYPILVSDYMLKNKHVNWTGGHFYSLLKSVFHDEWLNGEIPDRARELLDFLLAHPKLDKALALNPQLLNISGSVASNYVAEGLFSQGIVPTVKYSEFGEDENILYTITSKNENASTFTKKTFSSIAMNLPSIKKFAQAFDIMKSKDGYCLPEADEATKIVIVAALSYYENNASKDIPRDQRPAELALRELSPSSTDPFFMLSGISRWIAEDLAQNIVYSIKPNDSQYLKEMIQLGFLDQSYIDKLDPKHRREVLDQDMGL